MSTRRGTLARSTGRGLVAAMAMSGVRNITSNLGWVEAPPRKVTERHAPGLFRRLSDERFEAFTEVLHWAYGAGGGLAFGLLPRTLRGRPLVGPTYGLAVWMSFEGLIAPALGLKPQQHKVTGRLVLAFDHLLYGVVVGGRLAPEPAVRPGADGG